MVLRLRNHRRNAALAAPDAVATRDLWVQRHDGRHLNFVFTGVIEADGVAEYEEHADSGPRPGCSEATEWRVWMTFATLLLVVSNWR